MSDVFVCRVLVGHLALLENQELTDKGYVY